MVTPEEEATRARGGRRCSPPVDGMVVDRRVAEGEDDDEDDDEDDETVDAFGTSSAPLRLHSTLDHLLRPDVLLAEILAYAGPVGTSKLRNFTLFRDRMALLNDGDLARAGLLYGGVGGGGGGGGGVGSFGCGPGDNRFAAARRPSEEAIDILRACLAERSPPRSGASRPSPRPAAVHPKNGLVMLSSKSGGSRDSRDRRLTGLGLLALAQHSLSSERCLRNVVRVLGEAGRGGDDRFYPGVRDSSIALAVAENPASSERVLDELSEWDRRRAERRERIALSYHDLSVAEAIAENENSSPRLLGALAEHPRGVVRAKVAGNRRTPPDVLKALAAQRDRSGLVLIAVGRNPRTPERVLMDLSALDSVDAREAVASNLNAPPFALRALASDDDAQVLLALSCNENLPPDVLADLSRDERWTVRRNVAQHRRTDPAILEDFLTRRRESPWVRTAAAWNSNLTAEEVASALDPRSPCDRQIVAGTSRDPSLLDRLATEGGSNEAVLRDVAGNPFASAETLERLSRSVHLRVRVVAALNPRSPPSALRTALADPDPHVRAVAVRNPRASPECLLRLVRSMSHHELVDGEMMEAIAGDDKSTGECLAELFRRMPQQRRSNYDPSSSSDQRSVKERLAMHPRCPPSVLTALSIDESPDVRGAVAAHPGMTVRNLARMGGCGIRPVLLGVARNATVRAVADHLSCSIAA